MQTVLVQREVASVDRDEAAPLDVEGLYRLYGPAVTRWALRLGGRGLDLDDVVQEVFIRVQKDLAGFRGDARITTWLYRITRNVVGQRRRKERIRRWLGGLAGDVAGHLPADEATPLEVLERRQAVHRLYRVLDRMSERYRAVLVLFELEKMSGEEIALVMDARVSTVWVWLHRARAQFLSRLAELEREESVR